VAPAPAAPLPALPLIDNSRPLEKADVDPAYPGGMGALTKFLERHLVNPADVSEGETVSVKVKFVVGFDGMLKAFEIKEDGGEEFNKEVIRVLKKMPRWIPGKTKGQNVSVYFTIPVNFINGQ
jgi:protein TonB